ncbi:MAG: FAD-dependent oxidoreductase [Segetibacter sp.]
MIKAEEIMTLTFKTSYPVCKDVQTFVFTSHKPLSWQAGQLIHYTLPHDNPDDRGIERWFTIASAPSEKEIWITTRIFGDKASSFKKALQTLKDGDIVKADAPEGDFVVKDLAKQYVFIAGGIGITPVRSILHQLDFEDKSIKAQLLYANRSQHDIPFQAELESLSAKHETFNITYFIGDNHVDQAVIKKYNDSHTKPNFYLSGPEPMVASVKKLVEKSSVPDSRITVDDFPGYDTI